MTLSINNTQINDFATLAQLTYNVKSQVDKIYNCINSVKEKIECRYNISYFYLGKGVSVIVNDEDINNFDRYNLSKRLFEIGVPDITEDTTSEFSEACISYLIDKMEEDTKEQIIIYGDEIRFIKQIINVKPKKSGQWDCLNSDVMIIVQKLPITKEDEVIATNKKFKETIEKLQKEGFINSDNKLNIIY